MKIIRWITFLPIFLGGYICLGLYDGRMAYYVTRIYGYVRTEWAFVALPLCASALALHLYTVIKAPPSAPLKMIGQMKTLYYGIYTVLTFVVINYLASLLTGSGNNMIWLSFLRVSRVNAFTLIFFPLLACVALLLWLDGTVYRIISRTAENTRLTRSYEQALEDKLKSERFKTELIANVSHDIKTPLTSIINYVDLIERLDIDHPTLKEYTAVLQKKALRLKTLLDDLMEATKVGTGNIAVSSEPLDFAELIGQTAGEFEEALQANALEWVFDRTQTPFFVMADGRHLYRILENITANVCKHALAGTRIYAGLQSDGMGHVVFTMKNISREQLNIRADELTDRFVRGDRARYTDGSGLGLYIAKSLTDAIGGAFELAIDGDLFTVKLTFTAVSAPHAFPSTVE